MSESGKTRICVIFGGRSGEHEVSVMSARSVLKALDGDRYEVSQIGITHQGDWLTGDDVIGAFEEGDYQSLETVYTTPIPAYADVYQILNDDSVEEMQLVFGYDVIFPVLHGTFGEDGALQGLFELAAKTYIGAGVVGSAVCMDKAIFKDVMKANEIPVLDSIVYSRTHLENNLDSIINQIETRFTYPVFVKPANMGSSVGISKCRNHADILEGLKIAARFDRRILIEQGLDAREIEVSVLGNEDPIASIPGEIVPSREFYSYESKYIDNDSELLIPAPLPVSLQSLIQDMAIKAYRLVDCAGMARVDFLLSKTASLNSETMDGLFINEINTIPGFTKISMYPKLWEASGVNYSTLIDRLVELALDRKRDKEKTEWEYGELS
jgi:D-alanine-D-alanine ligase